MALPVLKWPGGKGAIAHAIISKFPAHFNRYFEPFVGGGAIFFTLTDGLPLYGCRQYFLSDLNEVPIAVYRALRDDVDRVIELVRAHILQHSPSYYYAVRRQRPEHYVEMAAWAIYLNRACYNGLWRENSRGEFNVPMGSYSGLSVDEANLQAVSRVLQHVELHVMDFEVAVRRAKAGDLVYMDPPYDGTFSLYTGTAFGRSDHERLWRVAVELVEQGVHVVISNSATQFTRQLYQHPLFCVEEIEAPRVISAKAEKRGKVKELLVYSRRSF